MANELEKALDTIMQPGFGKSDAPPYSELVRALAFVLKLVDDNVVDWDLGPNSDAALESARKLLLRAQGSPEPARAKAQAQKP